MKKFFVFGFLAGLFLTGCVSRQPLQTDQTDAVSADQENVSEEKQDRVGVAREGQAGLVAGAVFGTTVQTVSFGDAVLLDFPSLGYVSGLEVYRDRVYVGTDQHVLQFDLAGNLTGQSDRNVLPCELPFDLALIDNFLYVACQGFGIYEVNLDDNQVSDFFNATNRLAGSQNFHLAADGDFLWVGLFTEGLDRINVKTREIKHYDDELDLPGVSYSTRVYARAGEVWAEVIANADHRGGVAYYDRATDSWQGFGPEDFKAEDFGRIDFDRFIVSDEGVYTYYNDERAGDAAVGLSLAKFNQPDNKWEVIYGGYYENFENEIEKFLPPPETYTAVLGDRFAGDQLEPGNIRIWQSDAWQEINLKAKVYGALSPIFGGKYYLIAANGDIDVLSKEDDFPILFKEKSGLLGFESKLYATPDGEYLIAFSVDRIVGMSMIMNGYDFGVISSADGAYFEVALDKPESGYPDDDFPDVDLSEVDFGYKSGVVTVTAKGEPFVELDIEGRNAALI